MIRIDNLVDFVSFSARTHATLLDPDVTERRSVDKTQVVRSCSVTFLMTSLPSRLTPST
jgi:hypothetical protein